MWGAGATTRAGEIAASAHQHLHLYLWTEKPLDQTRKLFSSSSGFILPLNNKLYTCNRQMSVESVVVIGCEKGLAKIYRVDNDLEVLSADKEIRRLNLKRRDHVSDEFIGL